MGFFIAILIGAKRWGYQYAAWLALAAGLWSVFSGAAYVIRMAEGTGQTAVLAHANILLALAEGFVIQVALIHIGYGIGVAMNYAYQRIRPNPAGKPQAPAV